MNQRSNFRRVKERSVAEVIEKVRLWRHYFQNGAQDCTGIYQKCTLSQAAQLVGIPKKTLEDYSQLLRKAKQLGQLENYRYEKMGSLRNLIKQNKHFFLNMAPLQFENVYDDFDGYQMFEQIEQQQMPLFANQEYQEQQNEDPNMYYNEYHEDYNQNNEYQTNNYQIQDHFDNDDLYFTNSVYS